MATSSHPISSRHHDFYLKSNTYYESGYFNPLQVSDIFEISQAMRSRKL